MPVTAGKNTANTCQKDASSKLPIRVIDCTGTAVEAKNDAIEIAIIAIIIYWNLIAKCVLIAEIVISTTQAETATTIGG
jgi:hypothetical protein